MLSKMLVIDAYYFKIVLCLKYMKYVSVYSLMSFHMCVHLHNHHTGQEVEQFQLLRRLLFLLYCYFFIERKYT